MQSFEDIPTWLSDYLGTTLETAQVLLCIVVIVSVILPTMYLSRGNKSTIIEIVILFLTEVFLVGVGWMPFWVLIATVAVMAIAVAFLGTNVITGG